MHRRVCGLVAARSSGSGMAGKGNQVACCSGRVLGNECEATRKTRPPIAQLKRGRRNMCTKRRSKHTETQVLQTLPLPPPPPPPTSKEIGAGSATARAAPTPARPPPCPCHNQLPWSVVGAPGGDDRHAWYLPVFGEDLGRSLRRPAPIDQLDHFANLE